MSMLDVRHLHAVIKDTVRDESFLVSPLLLKSARELESWLDMNIHPAVEENHATMFRFAIQ